MNRSKQIAVRQRRIRYGIGIVLLLLAAFGWVQAGRAAQQANIATTAQARAEERAAVAQREKKNFPLTFLLAVEAFRTKDLSATRRDLLDNKSQPPGYSDIFQVMNIQWPAWHSARMAASRGTYGKNMSVAFSPDGSILASGSVDKTFILWNVSTQSGIEDSGYGVTVVNGMGAEGGVKLLYTVIQRKNLDEITNVIKSINPNAFYSVEELRTVESGIFPLPAKTLISN